MNILDVAGEYGEQAKEKFPSDSIRTIDQKTGWDVMEKGLPDGDWDMIYANHCIEHFSDVDFFLEECKKRMGSHTILNIGTPNLSAWFNRVIFLFGFVPHFYELSRIHNVGKPYDGKKEKLAGHIRLFNYKSLRELLELNHFKVISVKGEDSGYSKLLPVPFRYFYWIIDKFFTLFPNLSSQFRILAKC